MDVVGTEHPSPITIASCPQYRLPYVGSCGDNKLITVNMASAKSSISRRDSLIDSNTYGPDDSVTAHDTGLNCDQGLIIRKRPMHYIMKTLATVLLSITAFMTWGATPAPPRIVQGHTVVSSHDPKVEITLPSRAAYVGTDHWLMERYADQIELFAFVEANEAKQVQKLYWVQFEAYLPSRPELKHGYDSKRHVTLGGWIFWWTPG